MFIERNIKKYYIEKYLGKSSVVCKSGCFAYLSKLVRIKKEMKELSESLETTIRSSYAASNMSRVSPPRKHSLSQDIDTETPRKKMRREAMNTPTRSFLSKPFVESSPVVAVSDCIKCDYMCLLLSTIGS